MKRTTVSRTSARFATAVMLASALAVPATTTAQSAPPAARATTPLTTPLTIDDAVRIALQRNPDVMIAALAVDSARGERSAAGAFENPTVSVAPGNPPQYTASAPLDLFARRYRMRSASHGVAATRLARSDVARQVTFDVRKAFLDLLLADSLRSVAREQAEVLGQLLQADSVRLRAGDIAAGDLVTSELSYVHTESARLRADAAVRAARIALQLLLGSQRPDTAFAIVGDLAPHAARGRASDSLALAALSRSALAARPDVAAARERLLESTALRSAARASLIPVPTVGASYQPAEPFPSGSHYAPVIGFELPLFNRFGGERERAEAGLAASKIEDERTRVQVEGEVAAALDAYLSAETLVHRYDAGLLARATEALETARYAYGRGASSLLELLNAVRNYSDTRADYFTAVHDYKVAAYAIDRAVGTDLISVP